MPAERFKRVGRSQLVHLERITLVRWQSREQTHLFFKDRREPLTIGRYAAARLRELLDSRPAPEPHRRASSPLEAGTRLPDSSHTFARFVPRSARFVPAPDRFVTFAENSN